MYPEKTSAHPTCLFPLLAPAKGAVLAARRWAISARRSVGRRIVYDSSAKRVPPHHASENFLMAFNNASVVGFYVCYECILRGFGVKRCMYRDMTLPVYVDSMLQVLSSYNCPGHAIPHSVYALHYAQRWLFLSRVRSVDLYLTVVCGACSVWRKVAS